MYPKTFSNVNSGDEVEAIFVLTKNKTSICTI